MNTTTTTTKTTKSLTTMFGTNNLLAEFDTLAYTVCSGSARYTIDFKDVDDAIAAVEQAKAAAWTRYLKNGGNPRNKRAHGSQFAAVKKAIIAAA